MAAEASAPMSTSANKGASLRAGLGTKAISLSFSATATAVAAEF